LQGALRQTQQGTGGFDTTPITNILNTPIFPTPRAGAQTGNNGLGQFFNLFDTVRRIR